MIKIYDKEEPSLKEVQQIVKGMVEGLTLSNGDGFFFNEEGNILGLPKNSPATALLEESYPEKKYFGTFNILGNVVIIKKAIRKNW